MKRFFSILTVAAMMTVVMLNARSAQAGAPSTVLATILDKMTSAGSQLHSLKANLSQQKINTQIGINGPVESGTLYYRPLKDGKSQVRIDYKNPDVKVLVVDGDKFTLYQPALNQMIKSTIQSYAKNNSAGSLSLRFDASTRDKFNISYERDETVDGIQTSVLALVPKQGVQSGFKKQEIWVDHKSWLPIKLQFTEKNNDLTWVRFGNLEPNATISNGLFSVKPQPGTQIING